MSDPLVSPELLTIYIEDAREHLDALESCLLKLERNGVVPDAFAAVLGPLHTLKGNSGKRIQKESSYQSIPVIIISTEGKEEDTIRGLKMGAKGYVKKPFQASELHSLIEKVTE